jgi:hypothetical protein
MTSGRGVATYPTTHIRVALPRIVDPVTIRVYPLGPSGELEPEAKVTVFPDHGNLEAGSISAMDAPWDEDEMAFLAHVEPSAFPVRIMCFKSEYGFSDDVVLNTADHAKVRMRFFSRGDIVVEPRLGMGFGNFRAGPIHVLVRDLKSGRSGYRRTMHPPVRIRDLLAGDYEVLASTSDGSLFGRAITRCEPGNPSRVSIALEPTLDVCGVVVVDGAGVADVRIVPDSPDRAPSLPYQSGKTDSKGRFRITTLQASPIPLHFVFPDGHQRTIVLEPGSHSNTVTR